MREKMLAHKYDALSLLNQQSILFFLMKPDFLQRNSYHLQKLHNHNKAFSWKKKKNDSEYNENNFYILSQY